MFFLKVLVFLITYLATGCHTQYYNSYAAQRRAGYSYSPANSYYSNKSPTTTSTYYNRNQAKPYSASAASSSNSPKWYSSSSQYKAEQNSKLKDYSSSAYTKPYSSDSKRVYSYDTSNTNSKDTYNAPKDYLTNSYANKDNLNTRKSSINQADAENAKFAGASNQEDVEDTGRTALLLKKRKLLRRRLAASKFGNRAYGNPCYPYGRDANGGRKEKSITPPPREQGRFLWDINVYQVYPQAGCGGGYGGGLADPGLGLGGGGLGGGLLSDPIDSDPLYTGTSGLTSFLNLWAPGILQAATARPTTYADYNRPPTYADYRPSDYRPADYRPSDYRPSDYRPSDYRPLPDNRPIRDQTQDEDLQNDPEVDPNYRPQPVRRPPPNRIYYDSAGAAPITPGQLVGGVATTVNGIIQQLTGNVQPVYG